MCREWMEFLGPEDPRDSPKEISRQQRGGEQIFRQGTEGEEIGLTFKYRALNTSQQNEVVERAFAALYGPTRAAFASAGMLEELKKSLLAEGVETSTLLKNRKVGKAGLYSSHKMFYDVEGLTPGLLHIIGEMAVVVSRKSLQREASHAFESSCKGRVPLVLSGHEEDYPLKRCYLVGHDVWTLRTQGIGDGKFFVVGRSSR